MREGTESYCSLARLADVTMSGPALPAAGDWHRRGLCVGVDPDLFFPSGGNPGAEARQICRVCPVRGDCLDYSTEADEEGIWGGLDQVERRNLRRRRRRAAAVPAHAIGMGRAAEGAA